MLALVSHTEPLGQSLLDAHARPRVLPLAPAFYSLVADASIGGVTIVDVGARRVYGVTNCNTTNYGCYSLSLMPLTWVENDGKAMLEFESYEVLPFSR